VPLAEQGDERHLDLSSFADDYFLDIPHNAFREGNDDLRIVHTTV